MKTKTKQLQEQIDKVRKQFGENSVEVNHTDEETTISVNMKLSNPFILDDMVDKILGGCDSGCGFGYRDLQLCVLLPELK